MDDDDYMPRVYNLKKIIFALEGDNVAEKARSIGMAGQTLRKILQFRPVKPSTAKNIAQALKQPLENLFWR